jgi:hypothetical protein
MFAPQNKRDPDRKGPSPMMAALVLAAIIALIAGFLYFRPAPEGAIDKGTSPAAAPNTPAPSPK